MKFTPAAAILTSASPTPGSGTSTSSYLSASAPPHSCTRTAFNALPSAARCSNSLDIYHTARRDLLSPGTRASVPRGLGFARLSMTADALSYQIGFGNEFATEAVPGALPIGQNCPQKHPLGLYTEELNGTAFTAPRAVNRRTWTYRIRPSVMHKPFVPISPGLIRTAPIDEAPATPNQLRWRPLPIPTEPTDFVDGLITFGANG